MTGKLKIHCSHCRQPIEWRKVDFTRPDSYPDWRLEVFCKCGPWNEQDYKFLHRLARESYDAALGVELETERRNLLDAALGRSGNLYLETLLKDLPPSHAGAGQDQEVKGFDRS